MYILIDELKKATELTREGRLMEATRAIQCALRGIGAPSATVDSARADPRNRARSAQAPADVADVAFREVAEQAPGVPEVLRTGPGPRRGAQQFLHDRFGSAQPEPARPAAFEAHRFACGVRTYTYRLYVPPRSDDRLLPVILMLHGCTQDAADFAAGTAMNELAARRGCIVVYPEQLVRANRGRCWNWFEPSHQQRGRGEPAMIAALAQHVVQQCNGDPQRVFIAGLSAGGAMAVLVAQLYPDLFAAVGVHSGLPAGAASDVPSAHAAMRKAARKPIAGTASGAAVPTIVFHGRSDPTVHADNGRRIIAEAVGRASAAAVELRREEQLVTVGGRTVTRTIYNDAREVPRFEHWEIAGGTHAWSGGSTRGSHTDPSGPSASAAMIAFFLHHWLAHAPRA